MHAPHEDAARAARAVKDVLDVEKFWSEQLLQDHGATFFSHFQLTFPYLWAHFRWENVRPSELQAAGGDVRER
jgi:hypothetical protein